MTKDERTEKMRKFTQDPEWPLVEEMIMEYIEPLLSVENIDTERSNDEIATEVRGRKMTIEALAKFLRDSRLTRKNITNSVTSFK